MKKLFAVMLSLCLLCGMAALAEDTTITASGETGSVTVSYKVPEDFRFTVTIPPSINLTAAQGATEATGTLSIAVNVTACNVSDQMIIVELTKSLNDFTLVSAESADAISYAVKKDGTDVAEKAEILRYEVESVPADTSVSLDLSAQIDKVAAGTYSDTLTFTVSTTTKVTGTIDPGWDGDNNIDF